ncbi:MAG: ABC transporter substrate-binding protein [Halodesulfurarchaeum sp.]
MGEQNTSRRTFLKSVGAAAGAVSIAGCAGGNGGGTTTGTGDGQGGGTLTYARGAPSSTLDPQNTTSGEDAKVIVQIHNTLIEWVPHTTKLKDGLAKKWTLEGTSATLQLKEGITFHNGDEFTADDFIATFRRFVDDDYEYYAGDKYTSAYGPFTLGNWIKTINKDGDYTLNIELSQKYAPFLRNLAMFASNVLSETAIKNKGQKLKTQPVGTGSFKLDNWDQGNKQINLSAYDKYWGEGPKLDQVIFKVIGKNSSRAQDLISGGSHVIDGLGAQSSQIIENSNKASLSSIQGINIGYMAYNMARFEPFRNKKVRNAVTYAVDTQAIVENIFKGIAEQASQPITKKVLGYNEELDPHPHDPEKARQLLEEAGYGDGFEFELSTFQNPRTYNPSPQQAAQVVKSNLDEVGITVNINPMPFASFLTYTQQGKHDACFLGWMTDNADPDNFYYVLMDPQIPIERIPEGQDWVSFDTKGYNSTNAMGWANREFINTIREAQRLYDPEKRAELYRKAAEIQYEETPWIPMDHAKAMLGVRNEVKNMQVAPIGGPFLNRVTIQS